MKRRRRFLKRVGIALVLLLAYLVLYFGINRVSAPARRIRVDTVHPTGGAGSDPAGKEVTRFSILAYNIAHGRGRRAPDWKRDTLNGEYWADKTWRLEKIAAAIAKLSPDIVVLNEVDFHSFWSGHTDGAKFIAEKLGMPSSVEIRNFDVGLPFLNLKYGNALISRFPVLHTNDLDFPQQSSTEAFFVSRVKSGVVCTIEVGGTAIDIVPVHLEHRGEATRIASAMKIIEHHRNAGRALVAIGDFNSQVGTGRDTAIQTLLDHQEFGTLAEILEPGRLPEFYTFPGSNPSRKIDWVVTSKDIRIVKETTLAWQWSDHLPILVDLEINKQ